jgi:hypothetical protein
MPMFVSVLVTLPSKRKKPPYMTKKSHEEAMLPAPRAL